MAPSSRRSAVAAICRGCYSSSLTSLGIYFSIIEEGDANFMEDFAPRQWSKSARGSFFFPPAKTMASEPKICLSKGHVRRTRQPPSASPSGWSPSSPRKTATRSVLTAVPSRQAGAKSSFRKASLRTSLFHHQRPAPRHPPRRGRESSPAPFARASGSAKSIFSIP